MAYLDNNGLSHLWSKIVNLFNKRIEVSETAPTEEENKIWLQPMTTNAGAVDYIVEQGISGIWTYRKWNSGILECWSCTTHTFPTSGDETGIVGLVIASINIILPSEIRFINNPCCTGSSGWYYTEWVQVHCDASKNKISIRCFCNGNSLNSANKEIPIYCIGAWK